jgi:fatty-acid desaturase
MVDLYLTNKNIKKDWQGRHFIEVDILSFIKVNLLSSLLIFGILMGIGLVFALIGAIFGIFFN